ncbi:MAG: DUF3050 domain-containing protein [Nitrospirae bacterium]|nr:DUF3050 domain-containing protein [Magnetococcales bacterium]HAT49665.1 heme oxygenase [Alphaproteobacteria bacterium]
MQKEIALDRIALLRRQLDDHPVYSAVKSIEDLRVFMSHHIFSVWDFMSLLKFLQRELAPTEIPWAPRGNTSVRRFINHIVLEEETDLGLPDEAGEPRYASHFELYAAAMEEVGATSLVAQQFARKAAEKGFHDALLASAHDIPQPAQNFMKQTFAFIASGKPHVVAAAFALGREHIIPPMFRALIRKMSISPAEAPAFHYYLERHIHLDEDHHGPLSLLMLNSLCAADPSFFEEAETAAKQAIQARIQFWDGVLESLQMAGH